MYSRRNFLKTSATAAAASLLPSSTLRASIAIPEFGHVLDSGRERVLADHVLSAAARISDQIGGTHQWAHAEAKR